MVYGFDAVRREVWFESPKADQGSRVRYGLLCKEHADRMTVPIGWHLDDRRQRVQQLFRSLRSDEDDTRAGGGPARRSRRKVGPNTDSSTVGSPSPAPAPSPSPTLRPPSDETLTLFALDDLEPAPVRADPIVVIQPVPASVPASVLDPSEPIVIVDASEPIERTDDDLYGDYSDYDEYREYDAMDEDLDEDRMRHEEGF